MRKGAEEQLRTLFTSLAPSSVLSPPVLAPSSVLSPLLSLP